MTIRQQILKKLYPLLMRLQQKSSNAKPIENKAMIKPPVPFHTLSLTLNNGKQLPIADLQGKKVLLVNTASDCGYTHQYAELQKLFEEAKDKVAIIGFPANDFKEQEKGSDEEISRFCQVNYGVSFPIAKKAVVVKGPSQHPVYQWLTHPAQNGWNSNAPSWNFAKYLINEKGILTHYFEPAVSPVSEVMRRALEL
jgi:glutathione peroxidase